MKNRESWITLFSDQAVATNNLLSISKILDLPVDEVDIDTVFRNNPDADQALNFLERYIKRYVSEFSVKNFSSIPYINELVRLFGQSEYFAGVLLRREDIQKQLFSEKDIETAFTVRSKDEYFSSTQDKRFKTALHDLRLYKEKSFFRIGFRNIVEKVNLSDTIGDLSLLADFVIQNILFLSKLSLNEKYNILDDTFCVLSVGKLGGMELNYSSDVDLLYVYNDIEKKQNSQSTQESLSYYSDLASKITQVLSSASQRGYSKTAVF